MILSEVQFITLNANSMDSESVKVMINVTDFQLSKMEFNYQISQRNKLGKFLLENSRS